MVDVGDEAPDFAVPLAGGAAYNDLDDFRLSDRIGDGPVVLAFYPAAFTGGCTEEMCTFSDRLSDFEALDADVYGISVDLPFAQNVWMETEDIDVPMLSDWDHEVIRKYDVVYGDMYDRIEVAQRSVFVIDDDGIVTYRWIREGENPDFETFVPEVREAVAAAAE
ncbi:Peroxiredoxin [Halopenitus malekzadehii]|uniref:Peroxiredoxin n=1 Tax=Halopenitus malekzadehii TaxID=1267564 RepID=A0A1H6I438_9EURY|nr:redoxin domain-containing protein [Halopenitus malekzadehii]SEH43214.1 Peroxiredoxin [Halopenitus malekzadehii]